MHTRHLVALDGLRGVAALSVVLFHLGHWWNIQGMATNSGLAVDLFFCLSGYVLPLAYGTDRAPSLTIARFARVRLIRLMPIIMLATAISAAYALFRLIVKHEAGLYVELAKATVLGLVSIPYLDAPAAIGGPQIFPLNGPQYTLFLELVVNAAWFATRRLPQLPFALAASGMCFATMMVLGHGGDTASTFWLGFPRVGASFFAGVALFHLGRDVKETPILRVTFLVACLAMIAVFYAPKPAGSPMIFLWIGLVTPVLVLSGARVSIAAPIARRVCLVGGALSFPVYALHYPIFCWINGGWQMATRARSPLLEGPIVVLAVVLLGAVVLRFVDEPLRARLSGKAAGRRRSASDPCPVGLPAGSGLHAATGMISHGL